MTTALTTLTKNLAAKLDMGDGAGLIDTLKATAFKGQVSDAQMTALMVVANQYALNPWTKEIYAFPDKNNGIVPVVGVDGWARIINSHPQFDGIEFEQDAESCTCIIYRKDRARPIKVTEYLSECGRGTGPWQSHPRRMLRHKATIQCARLAFGYGGIYDQDEAECIVKSIEPRNMGEAEVVPPAQQARAVWDDAQWDKTVPKLADGIAKGKTIEAALSWANTRAEVTPEQEARLCAAVAERETPSDAPQINADTLAADMLRATTLDQLNDLATLIGALPDATARDQVQAVFESARTRLEAL
jgi:phage recombination protein Bet